MQAVRGRDTGPEVFVRKRLFSAGFRYRLHDKRLPGRPDIVLRRFKLAVFVNGCFWHGHRCPKGKRPASNTDFWNEKIDRNIERDARNYALLKHDGWRVEIIWQCELEDATARLVADLTECRRAESG